MSTVVRGKTRPEQARSTDPMVRNRYGHFSADGTEYRVTDVHTPRPWVNVISNPRLGLAVSQSGSGFTWIDNSQLAVITRWQQEFAHDSSGKFLFVRDAETGVTWSLSPAPTWPKYDHYECRHGIGYSTFVTEFAGVRAEWTLFCHADEPIEFWRVQLHNLTDKPRRLDVTAFLEWNCGVSPSPRREFHKLFLETEFDAERGAIFARNHMWDVPSEQHGHWNTAFPYVSGWRARNRFCRRRATKGSSSGDPETPWCLKRLHTVCGRRASDDTRTRSRRCGAWLSFGRGRLTALATRWPLMLHARRLIRRSTSISVLKRWTARSERCVGRGGRSWPRIASRRPNRRSTT